MIQKNLSQKVSKKQLASILGVCYKTGIKEYSIIIDCLSIKRKFLTLQDLVDYGLLK
ncbi:hypothetical protein [Flavobacterium franklandianum]|jgi:hypothetical protein|uniref:hypothetical protein n=1 Tax=Flavobacterium franklandianum TaxID=2594430 RepID=UPI00163D431E|nr:hypothetical protein [Flavobacterium franklandianum]